MPALPGSLALTGIVDGSLITAVDHRNNYTSVQTAVNALITALSGGSAGQVLRALSTSTVAYDSTPHITSSALSGGPPVSPADGDIWLATGVDANGTVWQFRFNAGSASASKWEFVGGPPVNVKVDTSETTASAVLGDLATVGPSLTVARAGDYVFDFGYEFANSALGNACIAALMVNGVEQTRLSPVSQNAGAAFLLSAFRKVAVAGVTAGVTAKLQYSASAGTGTFDRRTLSILPTRIT